LLVIIDLNDFKGAFDAALKMDLPIFDFLGPPALPETPASPRQMQGAFPPNGEARTTTDSSPVDEDDNEEGGHSYLYEGLRE